MHFELCQAIPRVLVGTNSPVKFTKRAQGLMEELREEYAWVEPKKTFLVTYENGGVIWWTFAGQLVNAAFAHALTNQAGKVAFDNLTVSFSGGVVVEELKVAIREIIIGVSNDLEIPLDDDFIEELKFGECLPQRLKDLELAERFDVSANARTISSFIVSKISFLEWN